MPYVAIPMLCIQAGDDPMAPLAATPVKELQAMEQCMLVITPQGGHMGFLSQGLNPVGAPWTTEVIVKYLEAVIEWEGSVASKGVGRKAANGYKW